jgi:hypothetical protein
MTADKPVKHLALHAAMNTHLSQSIGTGAFGGQHGMSFAISSAVAAIDISSAIATSDVVPAMTGRDNGAKTKPAIMKIANSRRMVICQSMPQDPTDMAKLKAFLANDVVLNPRPKYRRVCAQTPIF